MRGRRSELYHRMGVLFFFLFPFIYPLGLDGFAPMKRLFIMWELAAMAGLVLLCLTGYRFSGYMWAIALYHLLLLAFTLAHSGGIGQGLKKLFVFPFVCVVTDLWAKKNPAMLLRCLLYTLFVEELLVMVIWDRLPIEEQYYITGIRTNLPFVGFLALFTALACLRLRLRKTRGIASLTIALVPAGIFRGSVSTGIVALAVFAVLMLFARLRKTEKRLRLCECGKLVPLGILLNVGVVFFGVQSRFSVILTKILGESTSLHGRTDIWSAVMPYILRRPLTGYGAYGLYFPIWGYTLNYCHTESLQLLLDGGIILTAAFILVLICVVRGINACRDDRLRKGAAICLFCCIVMMISEVPTFYMWFFVLLTLMANLKEIERLLPERGGDAPVRR